MDFKIVQIMLMEDFDPPCFWRLVLIYIFKWKYTLLKLKKKKKQSEDILTLVTSFNVYKTVVA